MYLQSDVGEFVGQGRNYLHQATDALFAVSTLGSQFNIDVRGEKYWNGLFKPMVPLDRLAVGYYPLPAGDNIARGFVTIDDVNTCSDALPTDGDYFLGVIGHRNIWFGEFLILDRANNFAIGDSLAHVEASNTDPRVLDASDHTFYGWIRGYLTDSDRREPLPTTWHTRYVNGGGFDGGTDLLVWRAPPGKVSPFTCGGATPFAIPLPQKEVVIFDEQENPSMPAADFYFPVVAQRVPASSLAPPSPFGFLHLNLNRGANPSPTAIDGVGQSWISTDFRAVGRFSVGLGARALDNALTPSPLIFNY